MKVYIEKCQNYEDEIVTKSLYNLLIENNLLDFLNEGMTVGIKANLVSSMKPEEAATTHPALLKALCKILVDRKVNVIVGDSPGGLYTPNFLNGIYKTTKVTEVETVGATLNRDFSTNPVDFPEAKVAKHFEQTSFLNKCDAIINFCKLKTHGMMSMSCAVKNMFGTIPGTMKPEYHFRYPNIDDFANMLIDLNEFYKCQLNIVDAVVGMEGNGPTAGTPREIGAILASKSPYDLDLVCAKIIGLNIDNVPTLKHAYERNLQKQSAHEVEIIGNVNEFIIDDFNLIKKLNNIDFQNQLKGMWGKMYSKVVKFALASKPICRKKECVGCQKCFEICPAKAITMKNKIPKIDRKKCIKCFCCQEFCPKGAMKVKRPPIAKLLVKENKSTKENKNDK